MWLISLSLYRDKYELGIPSRNLTTQTDTCMPDWIQYISRGSLQYPSNALIKAATIMEEIFHEFHGNFLCKEQNIFNFLADKTYDKLTEKLPREVILCLARTRTYMRLREINKQISAENNKKKKNRKIRKFTNSSR